MIYGMERQQSITAPFWVAALALAALAACYVGFRIWDEIRAEQAKAQIRESVDKIQAFGDKAR